MLMTLIIERCVRQWRWKLDLRSQAPQHPIPYTLQLRNGTCGFEHGHIVAQHLRQRLQQPHGNGSMRRLCSTGTGTCIRASLTVTGLTVKLD